MCIRDRGGAGPLELDLGTEVSAEQLLADLNNDSPLVEEASVATAADDGTFESPAAGQLDLEVASNSELPMESAVETPLNEEPVEVAENVAPSISPEPVTQEDATSTDDPQFVLEPNISTEDFPLVDSSGGDFQPADASTGAGTDDTFPAAAGSEDAFPLAGTDTNDSGFDPDNNADNSQLEAPVFNDGNVSPANNVAEQNPAPASSAFATAWAAAQQQVETGHLREALQALSVYYGSQELSGQQHKQLVPVLDYLAGEVIYSRKHYLFEAYTVGPNDSLASIAFCLLYTSDAADE